MVAAGADHFKERISTLKFIAVVIAAVGVISNIVLKADYLGRPLLSVWVTPPTSRYESLKNTDLGAFCLEMIALLPVSVYLPFKLILPPCRNRILIFWGYWYCSGSLVALHLIAT